MPQYDEAVLERTTLKKPARYTVRIDNDDFTPMGFVTVLVQAVFHVDEADAFDITMRVHNEGCARVGEFTREVAEMKAAKVVGIARENGFPLKAVPEQLG